MEAWGTMGIKNKEILPVIPNSDPTRYENYNNLPPESCLNAHEPYLTVLEVNAKQYYLEPNIPVSQAEELDQLKTLKRIN